MPPNNSFKPKLLRSSNNMAEEACHVVASATHFGLTQALGGSALDAILNNLADPSWWFTAVFVAIIASLVAGYLQARVQRFIARTWSWYRGKRAEKFAARDRLSDRLASNADYLSLTMQRTNTRMILWSVTVLMFLAAPSAFDVLLALRPGAPTAAHEGKAIVIGLITMALGLFCIWLGYRVTSSLDIVFGAYRKFRDKNELPHIP